MTMRRYRATFERVVPSSVIPPSLLLLSIPSSLPSFRHYSFFKCVLLFYNFFAHIRSGCGELVSESSNLLWPCNRLWVTLLFLLLHCSYSLCLVRMNFRLRDFWPNGTGKAQMGAEESCLPGQQILMSCFAVSVCFLYVCGFQFS